jgi:radical SAM superfamily enzyme YgiQ (UPF0313 family)
MLNSSRPGILLVQPPIEEFYLTLKRTIPYGLASICASLEQRGYDTGIIDSLATPKSRKIPYPQGFSHLKPFFGRKDRTLFSLFHHFYHFGYSHEYIATRVRKEKPFLVGISSLFTAYCDQALETARMIKKFYPQTIIVLGGHHPTQFPKQVLACEAVDFVLRGEGEESLGALADCLIQKADPAGVPGIAFKQKGQTIIRPPAWIKTLDQVPLPAADRISQDYYRRKHHHTLTLVTSRGCPMTCAYCAVSATARYSRFRQRSVESVLKEIQDQTQHLSIGLIDFEDENLTLNKRWFLALLGGIREIFRDRLPELRAMNGLFPPSLDGEMLSAMKSSGFSTLNLSVGSFSPFQLKQFKRPDVTRAHDQVLKMAQTLGLTCVSYVIAGAPGQSWQSSLNDLICLAQRRTLAGVSIFYPAPGSLAYDHCAQKGLLPDSFSLMRATAFPNGAPLPPKSAITLLRLARLLNFFKRGRDLHGKMLEPEPCTLQQVDDAMDRETLSIKLARGFLADGMIRGVDDRKKIYVHQTDPVICHEFIRRLKKISLSGVYQGGLAGGVQGRG